MNGTLSDLARSSQKGDELKQEIEQLLQEVLPPQTFTVIVRNYNTDVRSGSHKSDNYQTMIAVQKTARPIALENKDKLEKLGFKVSSDGRISLN